MIFKKWLNHHYISPMMVKTYISCIYKRTKQCNKTLFLSSSIGHLFLWNTYFVFFTLRTVTHLHAKGNRVFIYCFIVYRLFCRCFSPVKTLIQSPLISLSFCPSLCVSISLFPAVFNPTRNYACTYSFI